MKNQPLVSVIIPVYNRLSYIGEAIESVLKQTYRNYEIIVVDDGSTIDVKKVLKPYKNIKYLYQKKKTKGAARNRGINNSRGKYLAFLDDDDVFEPRKLETQIPPLEADINLGFVYSDYYTFDTNDEKNLRLSLATGRDASSNQFAQLFFMNPNVAISSFLVRRQCFQKIGFFDESLLHHEDGDMFLRIALSWPNKFLHYPSAKVRFHNKKSSFKRVEMYEAVIKSSKKILAQYPKFKKLLGFKADERMAELYYCLGKELFYKGEYKEAIKNFSISKRLSNKYTGIKNITIITLKHVFKKIKKIV